MERKTERIYYVHYEAVKYVYFVESLKLAS
jgi:hypothetical protein